MESPGWQRGALMIEVLVTIVIIAIGLTGLMTMQDRLQKSEMESYQRTQAVMLVNDMASRISTNRANIDSYVTDGLSPAYLGATGNTTVCEYTAVDGLRQGDHGEWCRALRGAGERLPSILMTALVTGLGLMPLALGTGEPGREIEGPMATIIVGGLATSTLLNLLVLPTILLHFGKFEKVQGQTSLTAR